jgi:hypothetical protein
MTLEDIRDLAANYSDRQGLRIVPMGLAIMIQGFPKALPETIFGLDSQLVALAIGFLGYWLIGRYYEHRFGRVEEIPTPGVPIAGHIVLLVLGFMATMMIDALKRPPVFVSGLLIAVWLVITAWPSRRIRGEYLAIGVVLALLSLMQLAGVSQGAVARACGVWFGVGLVVAGIRDHLSFTRFFPVTEALHE